ncbi:helix-loop-helix protein delilah [Drosophila innubila]|uniref:helix-loop-helix protein delilah n=1 Tax=Drosophila innubila TaxID=198719 RepID=UPI00148C9388|nr:helix-loop-helix protein delilah [Drosophila innubila]XP_034487024.1 helix-loop-helix protein delilah [Drosophila innubila]
MKSSTYEMHNYAELDMELDSDQTQSGAKGSRKRKATNAATCRRGEKYSLRQKRQKRIPGESATSMPASPATELEPSATAKVTATPTASKAKSSAKTKAPPLSKYRRKTANARERTRMREINMAFEQLRHCVPQSITGEDAASTNEKLTKITTLRLAMKYIGMLSESLQDPSYESDFLVECLRESANREAHVSLESDPEADADADVEAEYELELEPTPPVQKTKKPSKANKKTPAKRQSKQTKTTTARTTAIGTAMTTTSTASSSPESCYASSSVGSPAFCAAASSPSSAYASLSSSASTSSSSRSSSGSSSGSIHDSAPLDADSLLGMQALSELNTLLLESDSESLHCLDANYQSLLASAGSMLPSRGDLPISMHLPLDKPDVELSLRLLDQSTDSFDFGSDQQPSACISPLATLDSFQPFADLLHGEFPDIFLA